MANNALDNKDCPPLMSDARFATDYRPTCYVHDMIIKQNNIRNSHQLRHFLQNNGRELMSINTDYFRNKNACNSCNHFHIDPNGNDKYWNAYTKHIGYKRA